MTEPIPAVIFIVEDDPSLLKLEKKVLEEQGYQVITATDFESAILALADMVTKVDLLILDIKLGNDPEAGLTLAKFMRKDMVYSYPNFKGKILVTTANRSISLAEEFRDLNIVGCLLKPFSLEDLLMAVEISLTIDPDELVLETGERVVYGWGSGKEVKMLRKMLIDPDGNVEKIGFWKRGGGLSVCVPVVTGYCAMRCRFCTHAYSAKGSTRKMSVEAIVNSVNLSLRGSLFQLPLEEGEKFDIVFAGEGDPSLNIDNTIAAIHRLGEKYGEQIRRMIVSTVSVKIIDKLRQEQFAVPVQLQISTVFTGEQRKKYMPGASSLEDLLSAGLLFHLNTGNKLPVILNYVLIKDLTDTERAMAAFRDLLLEKCRGFEQSVKVRISNYNPIRQLDWQPSEGHAWQLKKMLAEAGFSSFFWRVPKRREFID